MDSLRSECSVEATNAEVTEGALGVEKEKLKDSTIMT